MLPKRIVNKVFCFLRFQFFLCDDLSEILLPLTFNINTPISIYHS